MSDEDKKIEDMPLADLLAMGGEPERVQERDDEPGSGIAKLAQMVAASSIADAKRPSIGPSVPPPGVGGSSIPPMGSSPPVGAAPGTASVPPMGSVPPTASAPPMGVAPGVASVPPAGSVPPAASVPPMEAPSPAVPSGTAPLDGASPAEPAPGSTSPVMQPTEAMPAMGAMQPTEAMPAMGGMQPAAPSFQSAPASVASTGMAMGADIADPPAKKKTNIGVFAAIAVLVVAGGVSAYILLGGEKGRGADNEQLTALSNQLEALKDKKEKAEAEKAALAAAVQEEAAKAEAEGAVKAEPEATAEAPTPSEAAAPVEAEAEKAEAAEEAEAEEEAAEKAPASGRKRGRKGRRFKARKADSPKKAKKQKDTKEPESELGSLLDSDVASGKKSPTGALPKTPSRGDVKNAMRPIASQAAKCSKYSKGTVKLKITVGSNGRVTSSSPVGGTAGATAGNCVAMIARKAKFPKFSNPSFTFNFPVKLK